MHCGNCNVIIEPQIRVDRRGGNSGEGFQDAKSGFLKNSSNKLILALSIVMMTWSGELVVAHIFKAYNYYT